MNTPARPSRPVPYVLGTDPRRRRWWSLADDNGRTAPVLPFEAVVRLAVAAREVEPGLEFVFGPGNVEIRRGGSCAGIVQADADGLCDLKGSGLRFGPADSLRPPVRAAGSPSSYRELEIDEFWSLIDDPAAYAGHRIEVYGIVRTHWEPGVVLINSGPEMLHRERYYRYLAPTVLAGEPDSVGWLEEDQLLIGLGTVAGTLSYTAICGGLVCAPLIWVDRLQVYGIGGDLVIDPYTRERDR